MPLPFARSLRPSRLVVRVMIPGAGEDEFGRGKHAAGVRGWASTYKFTGKEDDVEIGLTYFGARYYSPQLGRWISPDPLAIHGMGADLNPYAYVGGRVTTAIDPMGLDETGQPTTIIVEPPPPAEVGIPAFLTPYMGQSFIFDGEDPGPVGVWAGTGRPRAVCPKRVRRTRRTS